jgi:hypothetical protein
VADYLVVVVGSDTEGKKELVRHLRESGFGQTRLSRRLATAQRFIAAKPPRPVRRVSDSCVAEYGWRHLGRDNSDLLHRLGVVVVCIGAEPWQAQRFANNFCLPHAVLRRVDATTIKEFDEALRSGKFDGPLGHEQLVFGSQRVAGPVAVSLMPAGYVRPSNGEVRVPLPRGSVTLAQWLAIAERTGDSRLETIHGGCAGPVPGTIRIPLGEGRGWMSLEEWCGSHAAI